MGNVYIHAKLFEKAPPVPVTFDPLFGFPEGRKEKVVKATEEELTSAKIPLKNRNYCSDYRLKLYECKKREFPFYFNCHHDKEHLHHCEFNEMVDRMKNYEREKRLKARAARIEKSKSSE